MGLRQENWISYRECEEHITILRVHETKWDASISLDQVKSKSQITSFLDTKIKTLENDPDKRQITTWNDYLDRIKYFFRWVHNSDYKEFDDVQISDWETPDFVKIKKKKSKRISPLQQSDFIN